MMAMEQQELPDISDTATAEPQEAEQQVESQAEPDYKALYQEQNQRIAKLENDARSKDGNRRRQSETDDLLTGLGDQLTALRKSNTVLASAIGSQDTEEVSGQINEINQEADQSRRRSVFERGTQGALQQIYDSAKDASGEAMFDAQKGPEFAGIRESWQTAVTSGDLGQVQALALEASTIGREAERAHMKAQLTEQRQTTEKAQQNAREEGLDMDTGPAAGSGGGQVHFGQDTSRMGRVELQNHKKALLDQMAKQ